MGLLVVSLLLANALAEEVTLPESTNFTEYQTAVVRCKTDAPLTTSRRWSKLINNRQTLIGYMQGKDRKVEKNFRDRFKIDEFGDLVVTKIAREDTGMYQCEVDGFGKNETLVTVIYLDAPTIAVSKKTVIEGDSSNISCNSGDAYPGPSLTIFKDHQAVASTTHDTALHYTISNATSLDTGHYYCEARNGAGQRNSDTISFNVNYIRCQQNSDVNSIVAEGSNISIPCEVNAYPKPRYTFLKNKEIVKSDDDMEYMIYTATQEDSGNYHCLAKNIAGYVTCGKKSLLVASCLIKTFDLVKGQLKCVAEGHPEPNTTIIIDGNVVAFGKSISTYHDKVDCYAIAECVAENGYKTCKSRIIEACKGTNVTANILIVLFGVIIVTVIVCAIYKWFERRRYNGRTPIIMRTQSN